MGWESFDVVRFNLEPLLLHQTRTAKPKSAYNSLILILEVCNVKPTHRKLWAGNLLMLLDLTFGSSVKVKRQFTGFGELSFWWIQICIGSPMRWCSYIYFSIIVLFPLTAIVQLINLTTS